MTPGGFELSFNPSFELVSIVRRFVEDFYVRVLGDAEKTMRLAIATHELLENAVKYAADGDTRLCVQVREHEGECEITVLTRNRATPDHLATLRSYVEEMNTASDPFAYYQQRMRQAARQSELSQLGLARIHVEADMHVSYAIEGDCLTIKAATSTRDAHGA
jgi:anti-sigma regulatory factor (Ser/Thr protein kinase)